MAAPKSQRALAARYNKMRERLAHQERLLAAFFAAEDTLATARRRYDETLVRAQAGVDAAQAGRTRALAALTEAVGNLREVADLTGASPREVRSARTTTHPAAGTPPSEAAVLPPQAENGAAATTGGGTPPLVATG